MWNRTKCSQILDLHCPTSRHPPLPTPRSKREEKRSFNRATFGFYYLTYIIDSLTSYVKDEADYQQKAEIQHIKLYQKNCPSFSVVMSHFL